MQNYIETIGEEFTQLIQEISFDSTQYSIEKET